MMRKLIYTLPFALMLFGSCLKGSDNDVTPVTAPTGNFTGTFARFHINPVTGKRDTVKVNFNIRMSIDSGYRVVSDTTTIHAGSKGSYQVQSNLINFIDNTYPKSGAPKKIHLSGVYQYAYDGTKFQFYTANDTLAYVYDLKKN